MVELLIDFLPAMDDDYLSQRHGRRACKNDTDNSISSIVHCICDKNYDELMAYSYVVVNVFSVVRVNKKDGKIITL